MNLNPPARPFQRQATIEQIEDLARVNTRARIKVKWIQAILIATEYMIYLTTFVLLFIYKVLPEYPKVLITDLPALVRKIPVLDEYLLFIGCYITLFLLMLYQKQYYSMDKEHNLSDELGRIISSAFICFLITVGVTFLLKNTMVYSRFVLISFLFLIIIEASVFRLIRKSVLIQLKRRNVIKQNVLIIGAGRIGRQLQKQMDNTKTSAVLVGYLDDKEDGTEIIGKIKDLEAILIKKKIDILYITIPSAREKLNPILNRIYKYHVDIRIIPEHFDHISSVYEYRHDFQYPCLQIVKTPLRGLNLFVKRLMDIALSTIGILLISPIIVMVALAIKCSSKGPVFFKQKRVGKNSLPFMMYKFRTMVIKADEMKLQLLNANEAEGPVFKIKKDPRVTPIGAFLRKYSIDQLPQLLNVLKGDMSLIGPRPPLSEEVERYTDMHWRRLDVRPGMTGLWQVSGRSDLTFDEWIDLDIQYIERWSLGLELKILIKTVPVVLKGSGAY